MKELIVAEVESLRVKAFGLERKGPARAQSPGVFIGFLQTRIALD
jgi:hypothetical protein